MNHHEKIHEVEFPENNPEHTPARIEKAGGSIVTPVILASRRESRLLFAIKNWIPGQGPRMTAKERHAREGR